MKRFDFHVDETQAGWIFSPIRDKLDLIRLLIKSIKLITNYIEPKPEHRKGSISIVISKMGRMFFASEKKVFSITLPFSVNSNGNKVEFSSKDYKEIDSRVTSIILSLIDNAKMHSSYDIWDFSTPLIETHEEDKFIWALFRDLIMMEDGYIRFDNDHDNVKPEQPKLHPLNHYDLFYNSSNTFKLESLIEPELEHFIDILNTTTDCYLLSKTA